MLILLFTSCKQSSVNSDNNYSGIYDGTLNYGLYSEADTITVQSGSSNSMIMTSRTHAGSSYTFNGTFNGTTLSISEQSVFLASQNATYKISGSGTFSNSTLTINFVFVSSGNTTYNWIFRGSKKT